MAEWDETDLTPAEIRSIWERATPVYTAPREVVASESSLLYLRPVTRGPVTHVDVHETGALLALAAPRQ
jgi:hypothetical protein